MNAQASLIVADGRGRVGTIGGRAGDSGGALRSAMSIYDRVLEFIQTPRAERFEPLALDVFRYQYANVAAYRSYCDGRGASPATVRTLADVPYASTVAFKYADIVNTEWTASVGLTFITSGTTKGFDERGRHRVLRPEIYRASALAHLRRMFFPDGARMAMLAMHPTADLMPESSLSRMIGWCIEEFGAGALRCAATRAGVEVAGAARFLVAMADRGAPVCILGTTAACAALFARLRDRGEKIRLANGSRLMDTGGAKGQTIALGADAVVAYAGELLGLDPALVINEYGMTEMCSQLYDATPFNCGLAAGAAGARMKLAPPWLSPVAIDPLTMRPVAAGAGGMLAFFDLANVGSISALMTEDFGVARDGAVVILGRAAAGGARGCALAIDEFADRELRRVAAAAR